eukprot:COSAG03_NODE_4610_length_1491_cov_12.656609_1_plen_488_part_01
MDRANKAMEALGVAPDSLLGQALAESAARREAVRLRQLYAEEPLQTAQQSVDGTSASHLYGAGWLDEEAGRVKRAGGDRGGRGADVAAALSAAPAPAPARLQLIDARQGVRRAGHGDSRGESRGQSRRHRSPIREECAAPPSGRRVAARDRERRRAQPNAEKRHARVVALPPKSAAISAAQAVLQSLGFSDAYEAFVALDEQATNAVSMAELRKGLRVLKIEHVDEIIAEIRSFRALVAHHNDTVDGRTFFGTLDWSQPAKGFSHRSLNAAYRRRQRILENFRQNLPQLLRERARKEEQQLRERAREEEQRALQEDLTPPLCADGEEASLGGRSHRRPAPPHSPSHRRTGGRGLSPAHAHTHRDRQTHTGRERGGLPPAHARVVEDGLIDLLRSATQHDRETQRYRDTETDIQTETNPHSSERTADAEQRENELRTSSRQTELRQNAVQTAATEAHQSLGPFLRLFGLERYHGRLVQFGVERVPDLLV